MRENFKNPNIFLKSLAAPATTSAWSLAHFDKVISLDPDLLLIDYGINDAIATSTLAGRASYAGTGFGASVAMLHSGSLLCPGMTIINTTPTPYFPLRFRNDSRCVGENGAPVSTEG